MNMSESAWSLKTPDARFESEPGPRSDVERHVMLSEVAADQMRPVLKGTQEETDVVWCWCGVAQRGTCGGVARCRLGADDLFWNRPLLSCVQACVQAYARCLISAIVMGLYFD